MNTHNVVTVYLKELRDSLRDRRTLLSTIIIPTLVMPFIVLSAGMISYKVVNKAREEIPSVMVLGGADSPVVRAAIEANKSIKLVPATADWKQRIIDKNLRAAVELPPGFDAALGHGESATVKIYNYESELRSGFAVSELRRVFTEFRD